MKFIYDKILVNQKSNRINQYPINLKILIYIAKILYFNIENDLSFITSLLNFHTQIYHLNVIH